MVVLSFNGASASTGKLRGVNISLGWNAPVDRPSPSNEEWTSYTTCAAWSTAEGLPTGTDSTTWSTTEELTTGISVGSCWTAVVPAKLGEEAGAGASSQTQGQLVGSIKCSWWKYCKIETSPSALTLTKPVPEVILVILCLLIGLEVIFLGSRVKLYDGLRTLILKL